MFGTKYFSSLSQVSHLLRLYSLISSCAFDLYCDGTKGLSGFEGGDTSSTALCSVLFYLARHQRCYDKLASEVRKSFQHGHEIRNARLGDLEYLRACINEALRMSPPVPGTLWRRLAPDEEKNGPLVIDGHVIPPGTNVGINIYSLHHNEVRLNLPLL